jgi:hypothetical protein
VFEAEWEEKVPDDVKPRQKRGRSKPMGPGAYLVGAVQAASSSPRA